MTLPEQAAVLPEAVKQKLLLQEDIIRWADEVIVAMDKPPPWVIDLSVLSSPHLVDCVVILREHATGPLALRQRIQVVVLAYLAGALSLTDALSKLFRVSMLERCVTERAPNDDRLGNAFAEWDCQEELSIVPAPLQAKFEALFREYVADAREVARVLPWRHQYVA